MFPLTRVKFIKNNSLSSHTRKRSIINEDKVDWEEKLKPQIIFPFDLQKFVEQPKKRIKRLPRTNEVEHPNLVIKRDEIMEEEEKKEEAQNPFRRRE